MSEIANLGQAMVTINNSHRTADPVAVNINNNHAPDGVTGDLKSNSRPWVGGEGVPQQVDRFETIPPNSFGPFQSPGGASLPWVGRTSDQAPQVAEGTSLPWVGKTAGPGGEALPWVGKTAEPGGQTLPWVGQTAGPEIKIDQAAGAGSASLPWVGRNPQVG